MSSIQEQDINAMKKALTRCKKNFTRYFNSAGRQTAFASQHPSDVAAAEVRTRLERVKKSFGELIAILDDLQSAPESTDAELDAYEESKESAQQRYKDIMQRILTTIQEIQTLPATLALSLIHI